jgi:hypothetical protein
MSHTAHVLDVFRTTGQDLRDDQILRADHRNVSIVDIYLNCPTQEVFLKPRPGKDDVKGHARWTMDERNDSGACQKIGVIEDRIEAVPLHRFDETVKEGWLDYCGDVDIPAQAWASPNDRSLCTEQVPGHVPFDHYGGEIPEQLSDRAAT